MAVPAGGPAACRNPPAQMTSCLWLIPFQVPTDVGCEGFQPRLRGTGPGREGAARGGPRALCDDGDGTMRILRAVHARRS